MVAAIRPKIPVQRRRLVTFIEFSPFVALESNPKFLIDKTVCIAHNCFVNDNKRLVCEDVEHFFKTHIRISEHAKTIAGEKIPSTPTEAAAGNRASMGPGDFTAPRAQTWLHP
jgi:hypothetical protein